MEFEVKIEPKVELNSFNEIERNDEVPSMFEYKSEKTDLNTTAAVYKSFRDQDLLTDVTLVIGNERLRAHKILLCKFPYFQVGARFVYVFMNFSYIALFLDEIEHIEPFIIRKCFARE